MSDVVLIIRDSPDSYNLTVDTNPQNYNLILDTTPENCNIVLDTTPQNCNIVLDTTIETIDCTYTDAVIPSNHAVTHRYNGSDPLTIGDIIALPNNATLFLNGTGGFSTPSGGWWQL